MLYRMRFVLTKYSFIHENCFELRLVLRYPVWMVEKLHNKDCLNLMAMSTSIQQSGASCNTLFFIFCSRVFIFIGVFCANHFVQTVLQLLKPETQSCWLYRAWICMLVKIHGKWYNSMVSIKIQQIRQFETILRTIWNATSWVYNTTPCPRIWQLDRQNRNQIGLRNHRRWKQILRGTVFNFISC